MPGWTHCRWTLPGAALLLALTSACSDSSGTGAGDQDLLFDLQAPDTPVDTADSAPDQPVDTATDTGGGDSDGACPTWYRDSDSDTFGDADDSRVQCDQPAGYVGNADDCDDGSNAIGGATVFYLDDDGDTFGDPDVSLTACEAPDDYVADGTDCDDAATPVNPATTWYRDLDEDGFGNANNSLVQCAQPEGYVLDATDCLDNNPDAKPGAVWYPDADRDGFGDANDEGTAQCTSPGRDFKVDHTDCNDNNPAQTPESIWYRDLDGDGFGDPGVTIGPQCDEPTEVDDYVLNGGDCVDNGTDDVAIFPGQFDCPFDGGGLASCLEVRDEGDDRGDGLYTIDPDGAGGGDPLTVFCDMTTDGGGWTALMYPVGYRVPAGPYLLPGVAIVLPNAGTSTEGWIEGTGDGCPGNVPGADVVQGWYGYRYVKCGDLTIQMSITWENVLGATDVRFGAALQGTPHRANHANDFYDDTQCDSTPDDDDIVDTSATYDADRDDFCGRREVEINGVAVLEAGTLVGSDGNTFGVQNGECGYWNGDESVPASFPTVNGESYIHPDCLNVSIVPEAGLQVEADALGVDEDLTLRMAAGRGCWPNCGWNEGILIWGLSVR